MHNDLRFDCALYLYPVRCCTDTYTDVHKIYYVRLVDPKSNNNKMTRRRRKFFPEGSVPTSVQSVPSSAEYFDFSIEESVPSSAESVPLLTEESAPPSVESLPLSAEESFSSFAIAENNPNCSAECVYTSSLSSPTQSMKWELCLICQVSH